MVDNVTSKKNIINLDIIQESVTIKKSDVERLGKELIKEIDHFLHSNYIINNFPELNLDRENFDNSMKIYKGKSLDLKEMYHIFVKLKLDDEIDGDLYYKKKSYEELFCVLSCSYLDL